MRIYVNLNGKEIASYEAQNVPLIGEKVKVCYTDRKGIFVIKDVVHNVTATWHKKRSGSVDLNVEASQ